MGWSQVNLVNFGNERRSICDKRTLFSVVIPGWELVSVEMVGQELTVTDPVHCTRGDPTAATSALVKMTPGVILSLGRVSVVQVSLARTARTRVQLEHMARTVPGGVSVRMGESVTR